jgi:exopolysaccharide biosynthesis polyprenyl glycosylphosphotransferase
MQDKKRLLSYFFLDFLSAFISWQLFSILRFYIFKNTTGFFDLYDFIFNDKAILLGVLVPFFWTIEYSLSGYYSMPRRKTVLGDLQHSAINTFIGVLVLFFLIIINDYPESPELYYEIVLGFFLIHFIITSAFRLLMTSPLINKQSKGILNVPIIVVGTGENALRVLGEFNSSRTNLSYKLIGFVRTGKEKDLLQDEQILGDLKDLGNIIKDNNVEELIIAIDSLNPDHKQSLLNKLYLYKLPIKSVASRNDMISGNVSLFSLFGIPMVRMTPLLMPVWQKNLKTIFDYFCSSIVIVLLLPLYIYLAIRVKSDSPGKIFFSQKRVGKNGRIFNMYKFRTMYEGSEPNGPLLSSVDDPRVTPYGKIMRKYRLDELPQFYNVLKGDMSLVGPRPEREFFVDKIVKVAPHYYLTQNVLPGITSWGMVKYGYANSVEKMIKRLEYDVLYLENQSILIDFKILVFTLKPLLKGKGV